MTWQGWKRMARMGLLGAAGLLAACEERQREGASQDAREAGRQMGQEMRKAAEEVREGAQKAGRELREGAEGVREGYGGAGQEADTQAPREREQR